MSKTEIPGAAGRDASRMCDVPRPAASRPAHRAAGRMDRTEAAAAAVRCEMRRFLANAKITPEDSFNVLLAAGEAISNGIRYGRGEQIRWTAYASQETIEIIVEYSTEPFHAAPVETADVWQEGGRGIRLMQSIMDQTHFQFSRGRVQVILTRRREG